MALDPDDHLATLVLRHVGDARDRLTLECVSRVWRRVGMITAGWARQDLTVSGALAAKLTNARFVQLLRRAGPNIRSLVINDAAASFTDTGLLQAYGAHIVEVLGQPQRLPGGSLWRPTPGQALAPLQTLDLSRCPGVSGRAVLCLLKRLRLRELPKEERLQRLALAGCAVDKAGG
jgi:hypothetical protein